MTYNAPLNDFHFIYDHIVNQSDILSKDEYAHLDKDTIRDILDQAAKFAQDVLAPAYWKTENSRSILVDDQVKSPALMKEIYNKFLASGYFSAAAPLEYDGMGLPSILYSALMEIFSSAHLGFSLCPLLTQGVIHTLNKWGDEAQKNLYLPSLISGKWTGTMNLTEAQAGSDVGKVTTKAVPVKGQDHYHITGTKIYISYGDHDLSENIIHLVLARLPDAPKGTKGLSLFIVPKYLVNKDGSLGDHNDVYASGLEEKMGLHSAPTCTMMYGEKTDGAVGFLLGEANKGMRAMFTMMNDARLQVGTQGVAVSEIAYQKALDFAKERKQGTKIINNRKENTDVDLNASVPIIEHPDIKRSLMGIRAKNLAARMMVAQTSFYNDMAKTTKDKDQASLMTDYVDFMIPLTKGWATDLAVENSSNALQIFGGMGYIEEGKMACHYKDARILPIYEGTNNIQAIDFVTRKIGKNEMRIFRKIADDIMEVSQECLQSGHPILEIVGDNLEFAGDDFLQAGEWMYQKCWLLDQEAEALMGATPILSLGGIVMGGYLLARGALSAIKSKDESLYHYADYARFYMENIITHAKPLSVAATRGTDSLGKNWY